MSVKINREKLLSPISEAAPCGMNLPDLSEYYILEDLVRGKEETQFSDPEPPDWGKALETALQLLEQGKELWVIFYLVHSLVCIEGVQGLARGLDLLYEFLTRYWQDIYPLLDDEDENPAAERMNILSNLAAPGCLFLESIKAMPVCDSRQIGAFSCRDIMVAGGDIPKRDQDKGIELSLIEAAVKDTDVDLLSRTELALLQTLDLLSGIHTFLARKAGDVNTVPDFSALSDILTTIYTFITSHHPAAESSDTAAYEKDEPDKNAYIKEAHSTFDTFSGISHRNEVIMLFDEIRSWYGKNEPSSPVPLFVERARSLVGKGFRDIISDIASQAENQITTFFGPPGKYTSDGYQGAEDNSSCMTKKSTENNTVAFSIRNQGDILTAFDRINAWYSQNESSSPVPIFVTRAKNLVGKDFQEIINDIANQAADQVKAFST